MFMYTNAVYTYIISITPRSDHSVIEDNVHECNAMQEDERDGKQSRDREYT